MDKFQPDLTQLSDESWSDICIKLLRAEYGQGIEFRVDVADGGRDFLLGLMGETAFQFKYFLGDLDARRKRQVEETLDSLREHPEVKKLTLVLPQNATGAFVDWFSEQIRHHPHVRDGGIWGQTAVYDLLEKHEHVKQAFFTEQYYDWLRRYRSDELEILRLDLATDECEWRRDQSIPGTRPSQRSRPLLRDEIDYGTRVW